jgi:hypothetical protein
MAVWHDLEPGHEREFETWYRRQHVPERLQQPGFVEARRYVAEGAGSPRYCAFYWLENVAALSTPQYLDRLAQPTRWTRRIMPWFRHTVRSPCTLTLDRGSGIGGMMIWVAALESTAAAPKLQACVAAALTAIPDDAAIVRAQLWQCDAKARAQANPEQCLRSGGDQVADWIAIIEGAAAAPLAAAAERTRAAAGGSATSLELRVSPCYRLLWRMLAAEAPAPCSDDEAGIASQA